MIYVRNMLDKTNFYTYVNDLMETRPMMEGKDNRFIQEVTVTYIG